jgi:hypothetical protein
MSIVVHTLTTAAALKRGVVQRRRRRRRQQRVMATRGARWMDQMTTTLGRYILTVLRLCAADIINECNLIEILLQSEHGHDKEI